MRPSPRFVIAEETSKESRTVASVDQQFPFAALNSGTRDASRSWRWIRKGVGALADQGMVSGSTFVLNIFLARWLGAEQYGAYAIAFSIFLFMASFHNAMLLEPMSVFGPGDYRRSLPQYLGQLVRLHFAVTAALTGVLCIASVVVGLVGRTTLLAPGLWGTSLALPFILFFWLWRRAAYLEAKPNVAIRGAITYAATSLALMCLLEGLHRLTSFSAFLIQAIAGLTASLVLIWSIRPQLWSLGHAFASILRRHWKYGRWVAISAFVFWLNGNAYYVVAGSLLGMHNVAGLRAIQNFVQPVIQFLAAISLLILPRASSWFSDKDRRSFRRNMIWVTLLYTGAATLYSVVAVVLGHPLIALVYRGRYTEYSYLLPWLALGVLLTAVAQGPTIALQAMQSPNEVFIGYAIGGITIVPGIVLTRYYGVLGAAFGLALSSLAFLLYVAYRSNAMLKDAPAALRHPALSESQAQP
jgi:O-antigen/teichoic acid export membrane protein